MKDNPDLRRLLWYLLGATRGGEMRARLIGELRVQPGNMNQLAKRLGVGYRTVDHHMSVLQKNALVGASGERYGLTYFIAPWLEANMEIFDSVCRQLKFDNKPMKRADL